jgi:hypothetical protein
MDDTVVRLYHYPIGVYLRITVLSDNNITGPLQVVTNGKGCRPQRVRGRDHRTPLSLSLPPHPLSIFAPSPPDHTPRYVYAAPT